MQTHGISCGITAAFLICVNLYHWDSISFMFVEQERSAFYCKTEHEEGKKEIGSFIKSGIDKVSDRILSTMPTPNIMGYISKE